MHRVARRAKIGPKGYLLHLAHSRMRHHQPQRHRRRIKGIAVAKADRIRRAETVTQIGTARHRNILCPEQQAGMARNGIDSEVSGSGHGQASLFNRSSLSGHRYAPRQAFSSGCGNSCGFSHIC